MIQSVLAFIGALFLVAVLLGCIFNGIAFHVYFGTSEGAREWHKQEADKNDGNSKVVIK